MKLKISSKTFYSVYQTLLQCISDSLQYQLAPLVWSNEEKRFEHYRLDQLQCLFGAFYYAKKALPTAYESISDFSLIQKVLNQTEFSIESFEKRKEFLAWYLRHHQRFFLNDDNRSIFEQAGIANLYRQKFFPRTKTEEVSYSSLFDQYQRDVKIVQKFYRNPDDDSKKEATKIYEKWGIEQEYIEALLYFNQKSSKRVEDQQQSISCSSSVLSNDFSEISFSAKQIRDKKIKLHEYFNQIEQGQWVEVCNLLEVRDLLLLFYSREEASRRYKDFIARNQENHYRDIRVSSWGVDEEQFYQELLSRFYSNEEDMNSFYRKAISKSIREIGDLVIEMSSLSSSSSDYLEYQKMLQDEIQKIHENYSYVLQASSRALRNSD